MKLRIRKAKTTHRLEVADNVTYGELKELFGTLIGSDPSTVNLSLNKKVELVRGNLNTRIRADGVQSGDLLWDLSGTATNTLVLPTLAAPEAAQAKESARNPDHNPPRPVEADAGAIIRDAAELQPEQADLANGAAKRRFLSNSEGAEAPTDNGQSQVPARPAWSLSDCFALVQEANDSSTHPLLCALHAVLLDAGLEPQWKLQGEDDIHHMRFRLPPSPAKLLRLNYELSINDICADCQVVATWLGHFLMISAKTKERQPHSVSLDENAYKASVVPTELGSLRVIDNEREMWIHLSNNLVRPLLADLREGLGLPQQAGLLSLPLELADRIISQLQEQDVIQLMMTCRELRTLSAADIHWEKLAQAEFEIYEEDVISAQRWGWLRLYKSKHLGREAAKQQIREMRARGYRRHPFAPFQPGPFRRPTGPYHQIGGDYDRNPMFQGPTWRPFIGSSNFF